MIYRWKIFVNGEFTGIVLPAMTEHSARERYHMHFGSASRYSGLGIDQISAVKVAFGEYAC